MGGKTSSASKRKYNKNAYDQVVISVPKGRRELIKQYADTIGLSVNELIKQAIEEKTGISLRREFETKADDE